MSIQKSRKLKIQSKTIESSKSKNGYKNYNIKYNSQRTKLPGKETVRQDCVTIETNMYVGHVRANKNI